MYATDAANSVPDQAISVRGGIKLPPILGRVDVGSVHPLSLASCCHHWVNYG
jgi:hypothetical protein